MTRIPELSVPLFATMIDTGREPGEYAAAFTLRGLADDPETDDDTEFALVVTRITIVDGETAVQDFIAQ